MWREYQAKCRDMVSPSRLTGAELLQRAKTVLRDDAPASSHSLSKSPLTLRMEALRASCAPAVDPDPRQTQLSTANREKTLLQGEASKPLNVRCSAAVLNEAELDVVRQILLEADRAAFGRNHLDRLLDTDKRRPPLPLSAVLRAYAVVLPRAGYSTVDDTRFYRFLIELSVDTTRDWWPKFEDCCRRARARSARQPGRTEPPVARRQPPEAAAASRRPQRHAAPAPPPPQKQARHRHRLSTKEVRVHCARRLLSSATRHWREASAERHHRRRQHTVIEKAAAAIVNSPQRKRPGLALRWARAAVFAAWSRVITAERGRRWAVTIDLDSRARRASYRHTLARWKRWQALYRWSQAERSGRESLMLGVDAATSPMVQRPALPEVDESPGVSLKWLEQAVNASSASCLPSTSGSLDPVDEVRIRAVCATVEAVPVHEHTAEQSETTLCADDAVANEESAQENSAAGVGDALRHIARLGAEEHDAQALLSPQRSAEVSVQSTQINQSLETTADLARMFGPIKRHVKRDLDSAAIVGHPPLGAVGAHTHTDFVRAEMSGVEASSPLASKDASDMALEERPEAERRAQTRYQSVEGADDRVVEATLRAGAREEEGAATVAAQAAVTNATVVAEYEALSSALSSERKDREQTGEPASAMLQPAVPRKNAAARNEPAAATALTNARSVDEVSDAEAASRAVALIAQTEFLSMKVASAQAEYESAMTEITEEREAARVAAAKAQEDAVAMQARVAAVERSLRDEAATSASVAARYDSLLVEQGKIAHSVAAQAAEDVCELRAELDQSRQALQYEADATHAKLKNKYEAMLKEQKQAAEIAQRALATERARHRQAQQHQKKQNDEGYKNADASEAFATPSRGSPQSSVSSGSKSFRSVGSNDADEIKTDAAVGVGEALGMMRHARAQSGFKESPDHQPGSDLDSSFDSINNTADLAKMFAKTTAPILRTASNLGGAGSASKLPHVNQEQQEGVEQDRQHPKLEMHSNSLDRRQVSLLTTPTKTKSRSPLNRRSPGNSSASSESPTHWLVAAVRRASPGSSNGTGDRDDDTDTAAATADSDRGTTSAAEKGGAAELCGQLARSLSENFDQSTTMETPQRLSHIGSKSGRSSVSQSPSPETAGVLAERDLNSPWLQEAARRAFHSPVRNVLMKKPNSATMRDEPKTPERLIVHNVVVSQGCDDHDDDNDSFESLPDPLVSDSRLQTLAGETSAKASPLVLVTDSNGDGVVIKGRFSPPGLRKEQVERVPATGAPSSARSICCLDSTTPTHSALLQPPASSDSGHRSPPQHRRIGDGTISIKVKTLDGDAFSVTVTADSTVAQVKYAIQQQYGPSPAQQRLSTLSGTHLADDAAQVADYCHSLQADATLLLVKRLGQIAPLTDVSVTSPDAVASDYRTCVEPSVERAVQSPSPDSVQFRTPICNEGGSDSASELSALTEQLSGGLGDELAAELLDLSFGDSSDGWGDGSPFGPGIPAPAPSRVATSTVATAVGVAPAAEVAASGTTSRPPSALFYRRAQQLHQPPVDHADGRSRRQDGLSEFVSPRCAPLLLLGGRAQRQRGTAAGSTGLEAMPSETDRDRDRDRDPNPAAGSPGESSSSSDSFGF